MKKIIRSFFILIFILLLNSWMMSETNHKNPEITSYNIEVEIRPAEKYLKATASFRIKGGNESARSIRIFLHKDFTINSVFSNGLPLRFSRDDSSNDKMMYSPTGLPVDIELSRDLIQNETQEIQLIYSGKILSVVNGVNLISDHLTEIALYSSWYPLMKSSRQFTYNLNVTLPETQTCVTDGNLIKKEAKDGMTTWHYIRDNKGNDIPVISSDKFKVKQRETNEIQATLYYCHLDDKIAEESLIKLIKCAQLYSNIYGETNNKGKIISVNSPRKGWGYSRVPLFVGSEQYVMSLLGTEEGRIRNFHGIAHEIAHFWWMLTDAEKPDNWIDEALAEFSSLFAVEHFFGREKVNRILQKYNQDVLMAKSAKPIVETKRDGQSAYVLFYEKGSMIFEMLKEMLGKDRLFHVLRVFYSSHKDKRNITTQDLIQTFQSETDINFEPFFDQFLRTNLLPNLTVEWQNEGELVKGQVVLEDAEFSNLPLELTFLKIEQRRIVLSPGENSFIFNLSFIPDEILVDENNKILKENVKINFKK